MLFLSVQLEGNLAERERQVLERRLLLDQVTRLSEPLSERVESCQQDRLSLAKKVDDNWMLNMRSSCFLPNTCTQTGRACAVHVRSTQSGIKEFTEHYHFPVLPLPLCFLSRM